MAPSEHPTGALFAVVAQAAADVASVSARSEKERHIADVLAELNPIEARIAVGLFRGEVRQGRFGIGWATLSKISAERSSTASVQLVELDEQLEVLASIEGPGSVEHKLQALNALFTRLTDLEASLLQAVLSGNLRQGALDGVTTSALAKASNVPVSLVRRAAMFSGDLGVVAEVATASGRDGLEEIGLEPLRAVGPMLASSAESVRVAVEDLGLCSVQIKLDGIRIQAHRSGSDVCLFTRRLNDVTERLPDVVALVESLDVESVVLDGEVIGLDGEEIPERFQDTASTFSSGGESERAHLGVFFFDLLYLNAKSYVDEPLSSRLEKLKEVVGASMIDSVSTDDPSEAERFTDAALAGGHEGIVAKGIDSTYAAGRRGKTWRKFKPVHTFDLVVLGAEWGHGRRTGWLSNLHLGAATPTGFTMVGKTFKGMTDEVLRWQTEALLEIERSREGIAVMVEPLLVVEIAIDGVQRSERYPGGVALRFARLVGYRSDKTPDSADSLEALLALGGWTSG